MDQVDRKLGVLESLLEFALGLARPKDQNGFGISERSDDLCVKLVVMLREFPLAAVVRFPLLRFER